MKNPFETKINEMLSLPTYAYEPEEKERQLFSLIRKQLIWSSQQHANYDAYIKSWPKALSEATSLEELPFLPVSIFKNDPPVSFVKEKRAFKVLSSSATTSQTPSRVVLDRQTAKVMSRGTVSILKEFIGASRVPFLVVDNPQQLQPSSSLTARSTAIRGLYPFSKEVMTCLTGEGLEVDEESLRKFSSQFANEPVLLYGFTWILWEKFFKKLKKAGLNLGLTQARVLHSGGWKRLKSDSVSKEKFNKSIAEVVGCKPEHIIDFYGMVEQVGVIYPDCEKGLKHTPMFADVIIRNPLTLQKVKTGEEGLIEVCSILPSSFPGHLILTDDIGMVELYDGCPCGRRGIGFKFVKRVAKAELRGCGDIVAQRALLVGK